MIFEVENKKVFSSDVGKKFNKDKNTIILIHGSGQSHVVWSLTTQYLSDQGYNVFAIDLPGHGNSEGESLKDYRRVCRLVRKIHKNYWYKYLEYTRSFTRMFDCVRICK